MNINLSSIVLSLKIPEKRRLPISLVHRSFPIIQYIFHTKFSMAKYSFVYVCVCVYVSMCVHKGEEILDFEWDSCLLIFLGFIQTVKRWIDENTCQLNDNLLNITINRFMDCSIDLYLDGMIDCLKDNLYELRVIDWWINWFCRLVDSWLRWLIDILLLD